MGWSPPSGGGGGGSGVSSFNSRTGAVTLSDADVATILAAFTSTSGVSMVDTSSAGLAIEEAGTGGIAIADLGGGGDLFSSTLAFKFTGPSAGSWLVTGANLAGLPTPASAETPSFGLTQDGNLYFYPTGGPWRLATGAASNVVAITSDPAPAVPGTTYLANGTFSISLPTAASAVGKPAIGVVNVGTGVVTVTPNGTDNILTSSAPYTLNQQSIAISMIANPAGNKWWFT